MKKDSFAPEDPIMVVNGKSSKGARNLKSMLFGQFPLGPIIGSWGAKPSICKMSKEIEGFAHPGPYNGVQWKLFKDEHLTSLADFPLTTFIGS